MLPQLISPGCEDERRRGRNDEEEFTYTVPAICRTEEILINQFTRCEVRKRWPEPDSQHSNAQTARYLIQEAFYRFLEQ